jgi:hypothetical protein
LKKIYKFLIFFLISIIFNGCWFSLGNSVGLCESDGCNYKEAGVCAGVIDIYKNRTSLKNHKVIERWYWFDTEE